MFFVLLLIVSFSVFKSENLNFPDSVEFYDPRTKRLLYSLASSAGISGYFNLEESEDESVRKKSVSLSVVSLVSFAAVIRVVTQRSRSPLSGDKCR